MSKTLSTLPGKRMLSVRDLHVSVEGKEILHGVSLDVHTGEVVALMGPNGSGKSTLAFALMGHPRYLITAGAVMFRPGGAPPARIRDSCGNPGGMGHGARASGTPAQVDQAPSPEPQAPVDILALKPEERAKLGLFLSFQYPHEIPGVPFGQMLRMAVGQRTRLRQGSAGQAGTLPPAREFLKTLDAKLKILRMDPAFAERNVNEGFSGGEKKRAEILQLAVLEPALAILDETDSGLDVDALRIVAEGIQAVRSDHAPSSTTHAPRMSVLLITHYERFLEFLAPDRVLVMKDGRIVAEGSTVLADRIQREGYERL